MEMGSGSLTESGSSSTNSSAESLNGFKFQKKICFEDTAAATAGGKSISSGASMGTPSKSGPWSSSSSGSGRKARVSGTVQGAQPRRCHVEGCIVDLSDAKAYYSRHKVCCMHSKSSKVLVSGLEQRFCQQCSRFHQLSEFDKGKRSCRRRLAGHNERRRKPPSGSLFSSPYENGGRGGNFIVDLSAYPRLSGRDGCPTGGSSECIPGHQNTATGTSFPHPWRNNSNNLLLQGSPHGTSFFGTAIPLGECFTGPGDSRCALSLLSNQTWGSRNQASSFGVSGVISTEGSPVAQPTPPHGVIVNPPYSNATWGFNSSDPVRTSHEIMPRVDSGRISDPGGLELSPQSRRPYSELEQSRVAYDDSMHHIHWSL
ncbi:hypothetical protein F3Y22_tig00116937pilonHSYRG00153 [Hibiscus syriacus]|uniref:SBP-type domain-containing protein n=1 Tax=Hibiscus syriacus TaxID=106335 RepID=A0A6A2WMB7_HIBSY|nr:squamosa promoter-binding-like protein 9 [Hibiscus syriacus]KAE8661213.1 hypothetical protein F3Y22_tig00116937pilonHSYRG00153 [Hibiscus syriacus]